MKRKLGWLIGGTLVLWLMLALPSWLIGGEVALIYSAAAAVLCLAPMTATLVWSQWAMGHAADKQLVAVLGGTGLRMMVVLGGALALHQTVATFQSAGFLIWVVVMYLATLALEVVVLVGLPNGSGERP